jgi:biopolymer transport protein ExbD
MAFSPVSTQRSVAQINITPLVDVMLVLLVIFMMAAPVMTRAIPLDLPQHAPPDTPLPLPREPIALRIDASGEITWNGNATPLSALPALMRAEAAQDPRDQPMLQIDANGDSDYGVLAKVLAAANGAGLKKIGFVRE